MATPTRSQARLRAALFLSVGLGMTGLVLVAYGTHLFRGLELASVDVRFSIRGKQEPRRDVAVVAIDDNTFNEFNTRQLRVRFPFPRRYYAKVIDQLHKDGAKVIAFDIQFTERTDDVDDSALIEAVGRARNVVLATTEVNKNGHTNVFGGDSVVHQFHARVGNSNYAEGGKIRRLPYKVDGLKTFALVTAERATGKTIDSKTFGHRTFNWIDFPGPPGTIKSYPFSKVYFGEFPRGTFKNKIVVVGATAPSLHDIHQTSVGAGMSGPEVHAASVATALDGFPMKSFPASEVDGDITIVTALLIIVLGLLAPVASLRLNLVWTLVLALIAAAAYLVAVQVAFDHGLVLGLVYPFGALILSSVGSLGAHYGMAAFERERVRDVFSRFVPEQVVDQVLARTDQDLRLGGVSLESTVMFTDLRGFTTFSEALPPARVIECLNVYLEEMTEAILAHGGTLVSYEGDGIMAVFGAPIEQPDHADRAVAASREMLTERLPKWNEWLRDQEVSDGFKMGIGLNTGMVVSGNVGSQRRLEYTAIGDTTNTASRLQGMTKGQSHHLFISDTTRERMQQPIDDLVFIDEFEVRGRSQPVKIWSIEDASDAAFEARRASAPAA